MKNGSKFLKLAIVGVLGAVVMISCGDDGTYPEESSEYDENGCREVYTEETDEYETICDGPVLDCVEIYGDEDEVIGEECTEVTTIPDEETTIPDEETTIPDEETTTTVEETTTTVAHTSTTVKKNNPTTAAPTTAAPTTAAPTTAAPTTATPTTPAPSTAAPTTTVPPVNVTYNWSGMSTGCPANHDLYLDVEVHGATSGGFITVRAGGSVVNSFGGSSFGVGDTMFILFDEWPTLGNGTHTVTITASSSTQGPTSLTTSVTYNCPV